MKAPILMRHMEESLVHHAYVRHVDASNPPLEEKVNQAESLLKVEAGGHANADGRTQKERRCGRFVSGAL